MVFIDREKAAWHITVFTEILKWTLMAKGLPKFCANIIDEIYEGASKRLRRLCK